MAHSRFRFVHSRSSRFPEGTLPLARFGLAGKLASRAKLTRIVQVLSLCACIKDRATCEHWEHSLSIRCCECFYRCTLPCDPSGALNFSEEFSVEAWKEPHHCMLQRLLAPSARFFFEVWKSRFVYQVWLPLAHGLTIVDKNVSCTEAQSKPSTLHSLIFDNHLVSEPCRDLILIDGAGLPLR